MSVWHSASPLRSDLAKHLICHCADVANQPQSPQMRVADIGCWQGWVSGACEEVVVLDAYWGGSVIIRVGGAPKHLHAEAPAAIACCEGTSAAKTSIDCSSDLSASSCQPHLDSGTLNSRSTLTLMYKLFHAHCIAQVCNDPTPAHCSCSGQDACPTAHCC